MTESLHPSGVYFVLTLTFKPVCMVSNTGKRPCIHLSLVSKLCYFCQKEKRSTWASNVYQHSRVSHRFQAICKLCAVIYCTLLHEDHESQKFSCENPALVWCALHFVSITAFPLGKHQFHLTTWEPHWALCGVSQYQANLCIPLKWNMQLETDPLYTVNSSVNFKLILHTCTVLSNQY